MSIETKILAFENPDSIHLAINILNAGGIIAFPTDTVYGIAVKADNIAGIEDLYHVKGRQKEKSIAILIGDYSQLDFVAMNITQVAKKIIEKFWPGGVTILLDRHPNLPTNISQGALIGVRMPDHELTLQLLKLIGPLATTSANLSGQPDAITSESVYYKFNKKIHLILDGGRTHGGIPSTVVNCTTEYPVILRHGIIPESEIMSVMNPY